MKQLFLTDNPEKKQKIIKNLLAAKSTMVPISRFRIKNLLPMLPENSHIFQNITKATFSARIINYSQP